MVSLTMFENTVNESKMVTPEIIICKENVAMKTENETIIISRFRKKKIKDRRIVIDVIFEVDQVIVYCSYNSFCGCDYIQQTNKVNNLLSQ